MTLVDTVKIATTTFDGYGDKTLTILTEVKCLFIHRLGVQNETFMDTTTSDASVYLDPTNQLIVDNMYRLEGMYVIAQPFGTSQEESWYRITNVTVAQKKLLTNKIDNILCRLQKISGLAYAQNIS